MPQTDHDTITKPKLKKPSMYKVVLHNDDFTPVDFVMALLERVFHKSGEEAHQLTMKVHNEGRATVGVYTRDVAETKVDQTMAMAARGEHPLLATTEEA